MRLTALCQNWTQSKPQGSHAIDYAAFQSSKRLDDRALQRLIAEQSRKVELRMVRMVAFCADFVVLSSYER